MLDVEPCISKCFLVVDPRQVCYALISCLMFFARVVTRVKTCFEAWETVQLNFTAFEFLEVLVKAVSRSSCYQNTDKRKLILHDSTEHGSPSLFIGGLQCMDPHYYGEYIGLLHDHCVGCQVKIAARRGVLLIMYELSITLSQK